MVTASARSGGRSFVVPLDALDVPLPEPAALDALRAAVARIARPEADALDAFAAAATPLRLDRGAFLLRRGETARHLAFVHTGLLRYFYEDGEGREHTGQFFFEGAFATDVASFTRQQPALQTLDALEPTSLLLISYDALQALYARHHALERFGRLVIEQAFAHSQQRTAGFLLQSAEARYRRIAEERPKVMQRVPLYVIASYLGITPEALSRIRARLARP